MAEDINILWPSAPDDLSLDSVSVHVWAMSLQVFDDSLSSMSNMLTPPERQRAASFHFDRDRNRFIAGRATLRTLLGRYLHAPPDTIWLEHGPNGKPLLAGRFAQSGLHFNLAHCEDLALLAVARGRVVGIDLERIRPMQDALEIAAHFCSPSEYAELQSLPIEEREVAFFRIWTRKEAWLKATGQGIRDRLEKVEVSLGTNEAARFIRLPEEADAPAGAWNLQELTPAPEFMATLAMPGEAAQLFCWKYKEEKEFEYASC